MGLITDTLLITVGTTGVTAGANATAGTVGEVAGGSVVGNATTGTCTITIAAPGVITFTNTFSTVIPQPVVFTTTGTLPTGITSGVVYYTAPSTVTGTTFSIATSIANAVGASPTLITTTGSQSGTQTVTAGGAIATTVALNTTGMVLSAGDWDVWGEVLFNASGATVTLMQASINTTSATLATAGTVSGGSYISFAGPTMTTVAAVPALNVPTCQINVSATQNVFLVTNCTFSAGTLVTYGFIYARRRR